MASVKAEKIWADAIRKAVKGYMDVEGEKDGKKVINKVRVLSRLAATLCESAAKGDIQAMKEVGDRLDGKPNQSHDHKGSFQITPVVNVTINSDDRPNPAPEAGNGATIARH